MAPGVRWRLGLALGLAGCGGTEAVDSVSDWPDTGVPWSSTVSLVADGVVLQPGDVLYLPTNWFHYIISLELNFQCSTRSGGERLYRQEINDCGF